MYSYEDRIRAIELYIKLGKRVGATIRQLGYPTENSLKSWHEQYVRGLDVPRGYVRVKPKYSQAQKQLAVQHYLDQGRCIAWTIKALGYPSRDLLRAWIRESHPELHRRLVGRSDSSDNKPVVHSDRGAHYRWPGWLSRIADAKLTRSMSRKGCSPDNAACEGFFGRLKNELFYPRNWQFTTIEQFTQELDAYIRWYNERRIKMSLGALSPVEYRRSLGLAT